MHNLLRRLDRKLRNIQESNGSANWKNPDDPEYDRQWAEDALYHTIGPLTDTPKWSARWTSPSDPVPEFSPGGPAPKWTQEEVIMAYAGDPDLLFKAAGNPRSPLYGNKGGAPLYRMAKKIARKFSRENDKSFISDLYGNGFVPLVRMMQPGFDESRSPFISYVKRNVESAMELGIGGTEEGIHAGGGVSKKGFIGLSRALEVTDPDEIRNIADQVKGKYKTQKSHDRHPDNPFGQYSSRFYEVLQSYADALDRGDDDLIEASRNRIRQLIETIQDESVAIRGAGTGAGQAISTKDRATSIGVTSMDAESGEDGAKSLSANIPQASSEKFIDPESVSYIMRIALEHDIGAAVGRIPKYVDKAIEFGAKPEKDGTVKIGGRLTVNEFRYVLRAIGELASSYPGKGVMRNNTDIPRDSPGWWQTGEDPEIEPNPNGGQWISIWRREGCQAIGATEISREMTKEVMEFEELGIPTARKIKVKANTTEAVGKVGIFNTMQAALIKLKMIAYIHRSDTAEAIDESITRRLPILEGVDEVDRLIIAETCDAMINKINRSISRSFFKR